MGLFSWLFGKPPRVATRDVIWLSDAARRSGAADAIAAYLGTGRPVLVLAHFPATLAAFGEQVVGRRWPHLAVPSAIAPTVALKLAGESPPRVQFGLVRNLKPDEFPPPDTAPPSPLAVVVLERHLLRAHDEQVVRFAEGLGSRAEVEYHVSMDDPLMARFAGEWVTTALRSLGMSESESIDSALVGRRIEQAQAKIAKTVTSEQDADSSAEWLERNRAT